MALTASVAREERGFYYFDPEVQNAAQVYAGSYCAGGSETHGTAAKVGYAYPFNDEDGAIPLGFAQQAVLGTAVAPRPTAEIVVRGRVYENLAVTGLAGNASDVFKLVYATDDGTFTFTRTTPNLPVGFVVNWASATAAHVYFFSMAELAILALAGGQRKTWHLLSTTYEFAATGNIATEIVAPCHGRILTVYAICTAAPADTNVAGTINLEIGGVNVTGGVVTYNFADTVGLKLAGTAVTAANVFHEGDLIDVEITSGAAGTVGDGMLSLFVDYEPLLGM